jgi:hypothetical protein
MNHIYVLKKQSFQSRHFTLSYGFRELPITSGNPTGTYLGRYYSTLACTFAPTTVTYPKFHYLSIPSLTVSSQYISSTLVYPVPQSYSPRLRLVHIHYKQIIT